ncbi:MAG: hypothetical protein KJN63_05180 [Acidimicrobiia bacterium]|nr:hypothetical protein [Acidimicrobiia bacterium]
MRLVFTNYLDRNPSHVEGRLDTAVSAGLDAAAERIDSPAARGLSTEATTTGVVLRGDDVLDGTEIDWEGDSGLTTIRVVVPWHTGDSATGTKLLAANRFAQVFATQARLAA